MESNNINWYSLDHDAISIPFDSINSNAIWSAFRFDWNNKLISIKTEPWQQQQQQLMKINFPQTHIDWIANATKIHKPSINYLEKNGTHKMFWFEFRLCYRPLTRPINSAHVNAATNMCGKVFCWCFVIYVRLHLSVNICSPISVLKKTITLNAIENNICAIHNWNTWFIHLGALIATCYPI